jgi:hypothetical protein
VKLYGLLLVAVASTLVSCASDAEKQWYKPGPYTVAEFERDRAECTRSRQIDEVCLRERGWLTLSSDPQKGPKPGPVPTREREQSPFQKPTSRY